jgi:hypothetical protein
VYATVKKAVKRLDGQGLDPIERRLLTVLLDAEARGVFRRGRHLDEVWTLLALLCARKRVPEASGRRKRRKRKS